MILSSEDFNNWCHCNQISEDCKRAIEKIRSSEPSRRVQGGRKNVSGTYPSKKMGLTIQFESHRVELARIYQLEHDQSVLEYYDQPYGGVELIYQSKQGRSVRQLSTPDFFVIREHGAGWEECKPEVELEKLAQTHPNRYCQDESRSWRCPPGEKYAARFGLSFRVWSDAEVSWEFQDNIEWLDDYLRFENPVVPATVITVQALVEQRRGLSLAELLEADTGAKPDDIYTLIATQQLYVDLYKTRFSHPHEVKVFQNQVIALAYGQATIIQAPRLSEGFQRIKISIGVRLNWDSEVWEIINTGAQNTALQRSDGQVVSLDNGQLDSLLERGEITAVEKASTHDGRQAINEMLHQTKPRELEKANERYQAIQPYLDTLAPTCPTKTIKRWRDRYISAEKEYGNGFVGLIPNHRLQGNRASKTSTEVREYTDIWSIQFVLGRNCLTMV